jgi:hypothetical protein
MDELDEKATAPAGNCLEMDVTVEREGKPVRIAVRVAGEGETARQAAQMLSQTVAALLAQHAGVQKPAPMQQIKPIAPPSPAMLWMQRNRARINIGFGGLLVALALIVPLIVPPAQRSDVLILTILFTLAGALLLFTAFLPGRGKAAADDHARSVPSQSTTTLTANPSASAARREQLLKPAAKQAPFKAGVGIALSIVFIVAGLVAPFLLGAANADERFLIMLGFVPITVIGFFMLAIFGRKYFVKLLPAANGNASAPLKASAPAKRAPVSRVPQNLEYRAIVPVAIISALVLMIVVVVVVIYATVASVAR